MTSKIDIFLLHRFLRDVKHLKRKYPSIQKDVEDFTQRLYLDKARVAVGAAKRGKQGCYRIIYYVQKADRIYLLTIYSKSQRSNISSTEIRRIIDEELGS